MVLNENGNLLRYRAIESAHEPIFWRNVSPPSVTCSHGFFFSSFSTLKMEVIRSSEMSVHIWTTWCYIPEDDNFRNYHCENIKWCTMFKDGQTNVHNEGQSGQPSVVSDDLA
jgi:hypothetical protein